MTPIHNLHVRTRDSRQTFNQQNQKLPQEGKSVYPN
jgi:hypothetical protein